MSLSTIDIIGGPDAYLLEDKEKIALLALELAVKIEEGRK